MKNISFRHAAAALAAALAVTASATARADGVTLKFATTAPPGSHIAKFFEGWVDDFNKASPDVVKFRVYHSTLGNMNTIYDNVKNQVADVGWISPAMIPGKFKKTEFTRLPNLCDIAEFCSIAIWRVHQKGLFADEFDEVPAIAVHAYPPSVLNTDFPVKTVDDLKGRKIAVLGKEGAEIVSRLGATPISIGLFSFYQSIQKGMVDGASISYTAFYPFKLQEVLNYHFELNMGGSNAYIGVGRTTWEALPADVRRVIHEQSGERFSRALGKFWDGVAQGTRSAVGKMPGHRVIEPTAADAARVEKLLAPMLDQWVAETPGAGAVINAFRVEYGALIKSKPMN